MVWALVEEFSGAIAAGRIRQRRSGSAGDCMTMGVTGRGPVLSASMIVMIAARTRAGRRDQCRSAAGKSAPSLPQEWINSLDSSKGNGHGSRVRPPSPAFEEPCPNGRGFLLYWRLVARASQTRLRPAASRSR